MPTTNTADAASALPLVQFASTANNDNAALVTRLHLADAVLASATASRRSKVTARRGAESHFRAAMEILKAVSK